MNDEYPVRFAVDYPDRDLNRLTTFFRIFTVIPIAIVLGSVGGQRPAATATGGHERDHRRWAAAACCSCRRC